MTHDFYHVAHYPFISVELMSTHAKMVDGVAQVKIP